MWSIELSESKVSIASISSSGHFSEPQEQSIVISDASRSHSEWTLGQFDNCTGSKGVELAGRAFRKMITHRLDIKSRLKSRWKHLPNTAEQ